MSGETVKAAAIQMEARVADIKGNISLALRLYEVDNGRYPATQQGLQALLEKPTECQVQLGIGQQVRSRDNVNRPGQTFRLGRTNDEICQFGRPVLHRPDEKILHQPLMLHAV